MTESLQFDRADFSASTAKACGSCQGALVDRYYEANGTVLCPNCAQEAQKVIDGTGSRFGRFTRAALYGGGAAIVGSLGYYWFSELTDTNWALVAIGVGMLVGRCVRRGSGGRGGWRYQLLAALLTYAAIVGTFIPPMIQEFSNARTQNKAAMEELQKVVKAEAEANPAPATAAAISPAGETASAAPEAVEEPHPPTGGSALLGLFVGITVLAGIAFSVPVMVGMSHPISLLIYGFGVWEAWRVNQKLNMVISGPYPIVSAPRPALDAVA